MPNQGHNPQTRHEDESVGVRAVDSTDSLGGVFHPITNLTCTVAGVGS